jgi:hypothetical protein
MTCPRFSGGRLLDSAAIIMKEDDMARRVCDCRRKLAQGGGENERNREDARRDSDESDQTVVVILSIESVDCRQQQGDECDVNDARDELRPARRRDACGRVISVWILEAAQLVILADR